jgi:hypothetical protein
MINPQKDIDLMNNTSITNIILFAVTIFQHSPLTIRVFYNSIRRERGQHHQQHPWNTDWCIYKSSEVFLIINSSNNTAQRLEHHQHQHSVESLQHEAGITA